MNNLIPSKIFRHVTAIAVLGLGVVAAMPTSTPAFAAPSQLNSVFSADGHSRPVSDGSGGDIYLEKGIVLPLSVESSESGIVLKEFSFHASLPNEIRDDDELKKAFTLNELSRLTEISEFSSPLELPSRDEEQPNDARTFYQKSTNIDGNNSRFMSLYSRIIEYSGGSNHIETEDVYDHITHEALLWDKANGLLIMHGEEVFLDNLASLRASYCAALKNEKVGRTAASNTVRPIQDKSLQSDCPPFERLAISFAGRPGEAFDTIKFTGAGSVTDHFGDDIYSFSFAMTKSLFAKIKPQYRFGFKVYKVPN